MSRVRMCKRLDASPTYKGGKVYLKVQYVDSDDYELVYLGEEHEITRVGHPYTDTDFWYIDVQKGNERERILLGRVLEPTKKEG